MRKTAVVVALVLAACAPQESNGPLEVRVEATSPWATTSAAVERTKTTAEVAAEVWGIPAEALNGWTITVVEDTFICEGDVVLGCTWSGPKDIKVAVAHESCIERTILAHEIGHLIIQGHDDPRFCSETFWRQMFWALERNSIPEWDSGCYLGEDMYVRMNIAACGAPK